MGDVCWSRETRVVIRHGRQVASEVPPPKRQQTPVPVFYPRNPSLCRREMTRQPWQNHLSLSMVSPFHTMHPSVQIAPRHHPLASRLRSFRQRFGSAALEQAHLAALVGIHVRQLRAMESLRCVPSVLRTWLAVAAALHCSLEDLLAPLAPDACRVVVLVTRSRAVVALCAEGESILEVRRLGRGRHRLQSAASVVQALAADYAASRVLVNLGTHQPALSALACEHVGLDCVQRRLGLPDRRIATVCRHVQGRLPHLSRFARFSRATGEILPWDRAGQAVYLAAAIALAVCTDVQWQQQLQLPI